MPDASPSAPDGASSGSETPPPGGDFARLLGAVQEGDGAAFDRLVALAYEELRGLARAQRRRFGASNTLNTTALVHVAYERLAGGAGAPALSSRTHFFRVTARAMRAALVDYARKQSAAKRGGRARPLSLNEAMWVPPEQADEVVALDEALERLARLDRRQCEVVELRYFVGLTIPETADVLEVSPATVKRTWAAARAWLHRELSASP